MKTIQELYNEIMASQELKARWIEAAKAGKQEAFLKEHGCEATLEEVAAFLKAKSEADAPLSMNELENSAGGTCNEATGYETLKSFVFLAGIGCAVIAVMSAAGYDGGHAGQTDQYDGRLCNK